MGPTKHSRLIGIGFGLSMLLGPGVVSGFAQPPAMPNGVEESHLFQLAGTVEGPEMTGAVFENPQTKKQRTYHVGDVIDGASIVAIRHQQVVLKRGEEFVVVRITGGSPVAGRPAGGPPERAPGDLIPVPAGDAGLARQFVVSKVIAAYDPRVEQLKAPVSRKDIKRFASYFQEQLNEASPIFVTTPQVGETVDLGAVDTEMIQRLRLEPTDRIISINGIGIDSPDAFRQILEILGGNRVSMLNIVVLRGEAVQPLYYAIQ